jgi:hypothetical protein
MKPPSDLRTAIIAVAVLEAMALAAFICSVLWK